jgi:hypothetical protein
MEEADSLRAGFRSSHTLHFFKIGRVGRAAPLVVVIDVFRSHPLKIALRLRSGQATDGATSNFLELHGEEDWANPPTRKSAVVLLPRELILDIAEPDPMRAVAPL